MRVRYDLQYPCSISSCIEARLSKYTGNIPIYIIGKHYSRVGGNFFSELPKATHGDGALGFVSVTLSVALNVLPFTTFAGTEGDPAVSVSGICIERNRLLGLLKFATVASTTSAYDAGLGKKLPLIWRSISHSNISTVCLSVFVVPTIIWLFGQQAQDVIVVVLLVGLLSRLLSPSKDVAFVDISAPGQLTRRRGNYFCPFGVLFSAAYSIF